MVDHLNKLRQQDFIRGGWGIRREDTREDYTPEERMWFRKQVEAKDGARLGKSTETEARMAERFNDDFGASRTPGGVGGAYDRARRNCGNPDSESNVNQARRSKQKEAAKRRKEEKKERVRRARDQVSEETVGV